MEMTYDDFLTSKRREWSGDGLSISDADVPNGLFPFQARLTQWALRKGRAAIFSTTGTGKTRMQLAWANAIPGRVLILAPLCVSQQTMAEGEKIDVAVGLVGHGSRIEITNYERLHHVNPSDYAGVVLDESGILKAYDGKTRTRLIRAFADTPYRLCCTATPAPNDTAELANHCEFLGVMSRAEMLASFFVHVEDETGGRHMWRLKGHAHDAFYRWLASWGMFLRQPSDIGFSDDGYVLPELRIHQHIVEAGEGMAGEYLFAGMNAAGLRGRLAARRGSLDARVRKALELVQGDDQAIIWCGLNAEQDSIAAALNGASASVQGSDSEEDKIANLTAFLRGERRVLISKVRVAGFGLNLQHCRRMVFLGLGDSFEQYFQAIRRCWRFGQTRAVDVHVVVGEAETHIVANVQRKEREYDEVSTRMIEHMRIAEQEELGVTTRQRETFAPEQASGQAWTMYLGDCIETMERLPEHSVDLSVFSPPFLSLYTYSATERDLGNCTDRQEFLDHFRYVVQGLMRVTKPGRLVCCHIAQPATTLVNHGVIGLSDLRGAVIEAFVRDGFVYHGDICVDKDPQVQAVRTKTKALLFVQLHKDASWLRPGLADYILVFRAPGDNAVPILPDITNDDWIEWARPVWYGIRESDVLPVRAARSNEDERHLCPLQLPVIERCIRLWSNPGEVILSPFAGIGSEGYEAIRLGRRFIGIELKREYWQGAVRVLTELETTMNAQASLAL